MTVTLSAACDVSATSQSRPTSRARSDSTARDCGRPVHRAAYLHLPRRLASYRFGFAPGASTLLAAAVDGAVAFVSRARLVSYVRAKKAWRCADGARHVPARKTKRRAGAGRPLRDTALTAAVLALTAVAFAVVADHGILAQIQRADDAWLRLMISGRSAPVTAVAKVFNWLGLVYVTLPVRIAIGGYLAWRRRWWQLAAFAAAVVLSEVLIGTLKGSYDRARPPGSLVATSGASFPSGHSVAATVTVVAAVIALVPPGRARVAWGAAAAGFSVLMALSRAYLGATGCPTPSPGSSSGLRARC